jgi:amino acid transporter
MAGADISGDLKNPGQAIPKGTILAILTTTTTYLMVLWTTGSTMVRDADGLSSPLLKNSQYLVNGLKQYEQPICAMNSTCPYGLVNYYQVC